MDSIFSEENERNTTNNQEVKRFMIEQKSPLYLTTCTGNTDIWMDSCSHEEMSYAISHGAVGATTNPTIVGEVLKKEMPFWEGKIKEIASQEPEGTEDDISWRLIEGMALKGSLLLRNIFEREKGKKGRISIQTNPKFYRDPVLMATQAVYFSSLAPNIQVKIPVTKAGLVAIEEATYKGVSINATVSFTVPQALAVAEAIERGLMRRESEGHDISQMSPVCTIMAGRLDDWLKVVANKMNITTNPGYLEWAGIAVIKKAYKIYKERGYKTRLLVAAYRNYMHWSEFIGGDVVLTIPYIWQKRLNACDVEVKNRIYDPVDPEIVKELYSKFGDFRRAYDENGMSAEEFDQFGATVRTLRNFIKSYENLVSVVRDIMLPNPDA